MSGRIVARVASRFLKTAGPLRDVSKLRYQAVFLMGAGGSGKGFVGNRWMKYMPGGGETGIPAEVLKDKLKESLKEKERGLSNLDFQRALDKLTNTGEFKVELVPNKGAKIPFRLYQYNSGGEQEYIPPENWKNRLPAEVYRDVQGLTDVIFSTPVHELPSYWRQVNPDLYKEELAGYLEHEPGYVHEMSSLMSKAYFQAILNTGDPIFVDQTGSNPKKMEAQIREAKEAGYRVTLVLVIVPLTINQIRNATRSRNVHPRQITQQWKDIQSSFLQIRGLADKAKVIDNRNDSQDISKYHREAGKINSFIQRTTGYDNLYEYIREVQPSELSTYGKLLSP